MRAAPAVAVRCTGGWPWRLLTTVLAALAAAAVSAWALLHLEASATPAAAAAGLVGLLAWRRTRSTDRLLQWDGQRWTVEGRPGHLQLMMDLGPFLLLRLCPETGAASWLPVTAHEAGAAWHGLRAAVYARPFKTTPGMPQPDRVAD